MSWVAVGTAAAVVVGGVIQSDSASQASKQQQVQSDKGIASNNQNLSLTRADQQPYRVAGAKGIDALQRMLGFGDPNQAARDQAAMAAGIKKPTMDDAASAHLAWHVQHFGTGYTANSDMAAKERQTQDIYDQMLSDYNTKVAQLPGADSGPEPSFGSLSKKFSVDDFWSDPVVQLGYQSGLDLGTKALKNAAPLTTGLDSGAALKELVKFGTDYSGSKAGDSFARFEGDKTNVFNRLASMAGIGQVSNQVAANTGANTATNNAQVMTAQGNANAASTIARGNAAAGGMNTIANWWQQQAMIDKLNAGRTSGTTGGMPSNFDYTGWTSAGGNQYG